MVDRRFVGWVEHLRNPSLPAPSDDANIKLRLRAPRFGGLKPAEARLASVGRLPPILERAASPSKKPIDQHADGHPRQRRRNADPDRLGHRARNVVPPAIRPRPTPSATSSAIVTPAETTRACGT